MRTRKDRKRLWSVHWLLLLFCCVGLLFGRTITAYAGTLMGVTNLRQTDAGESSFKVEWDKDINAEGYEFQYSVDGNNWSDSSYVSKYLLYKSVSSLNSGRTYQIRMRSFDRSSNLPFRPADGAVFSPWTTWEAVTSPKAVLGDDIKQTSATRNSVTVSWKPADGATYYDVMYKMGNSWFKGGTTTASSYTIKKLDTDTSYNVCLKAVRKSGMGYEGGTDRTSPHQCYTTSDKVTGCTLKKWNTSTNQITLEWNDVSRYETGYQVYVYNLSGKKVKSFKTTGKSEEFRLSSVKNQGFTFQVRTYRDIDGKTIYGPWSSKKAVVAQPRLKLKQSGSRSIQLSWQKIKGATSYTIYRSTSASTGFKKIKTVTGTKYTDKGLNSKKTYYYYVVANGVKVNGKATKTTKATNREIAYLYSKKVKYRW